MPAKKKTTPTPEPSEFTGPINEVDVVVFVPRGAVRESDIKRAALNEASDRIPLAAYGVKVDIQSAGEVKTVDGQDGRDYQIKVSFTPRGKTKASPIVAQDAPDVEADTADKVLKALEPLTPEAVSSVIEANEV